MMLTTIIHTFIIMITVFYLGSGQEEAESDSPVLASINQCCSLGAERAQSDQLSCEAQITLLLGPDIIDKVGFH